MWGWASRVSLATVATVGWAACLTGLSAGSVFRTLGIYGAVATVGLMVSDRRPTMELLAPNRRVIMTGVLGGVLTAIATHLGYAFTLWIWPSFAAQTRCLFAVFEALPGSAASLHWLVLIIVAEEVLWRGAWVTILGARWSVVAVVVPTILYAIAQLASGLWLVGALALGCGLVWTVERLWTRSLLAPLITHLIWDLGVMVWIPIDIPGTC
ncbi:MAG: hypothetical protein A2289_07465 [Deltaproteobacteria bacterium RIFOXYA12_FULL_58_15]|nr:MAG: hypothetical protein A2289_07465 [Deltaproteobacteria bacterium RIFOXYA12_FULL_58_15]OGR10193.1 MAG: hypothetical protein A2341_06235 [Deltaproteobacteria bacterium RIFOXYB12_FULL_58_9]